MAADGLEHGYDLIVVGLGGLGSSTCWHAARRGLRVLGLEQFDLGHDRGASHDTSRILRHSYHTPGYVALTFRAYDDWAELEQESGEELVTVTGGVDLFPPDAAIPMTDYTSSMSAHSIGYEVLDAAALGERWPQFRLPEGTTGLVQERTAIVPAARGTAAMQAAARRRGATLRDNTRVTSLRPVGDGVAVTTSAGVVHAGRVVVTADAWTAGLLAPLGVDLPLTVLEEQVSYFAPTEPAHYGPDRFPVWIWMDDPSYYGFPTYGATTVKAAQDCGGPVVTADERSGSPDEVMGDRLSKFMATMLPGSGPPVSSKRCLYTLTPDRDFVASRVPGAPAVTVGLGAAHAFKFAATFGGLLTDLAVEGATAADVSAFGLDRPALTDPAFEPSWMV
ncbi:MAG TPA: N-methyl-L-tryptophan oxidase [Candidatus Nanopelagicales bacterium]|jgi:sarcosine oxidase|nr:N-methyl-L-tryptophan oxidase [Candidatus Nanopelagicales bacterium]